MERGIVRKRERENLKSERKTERTKEKQKESFFWKLLQRFPQPGSCHLEWVYSLILIGMLPLSYFGPRPSANYE